MFDCRQNQSNDIGNCGQHGSNIFDLLRNFTKCKQTLIYMFVSILSSSFTKRCEDKATTVSQVYPWLNKHGRHGHPERTKHGNNHATQAHQSRSNDCSVGIQRPCLIARCWGLDTVHTPCVQICFPEIEGLWAGAKSACPHIDVENWHSIQTLPVQYQPKNINVRFPKKYLKNIGVKVSSSNSRKYQEAANMLVGVTIFDYTISSMWLSCNSHK